MDTCKLGAIGDRPAELAHHLGVELERLGEREVGVGVGDELDAAESTVAAIRATPVVAA